MSDLYVVKQQLKEAKEIIQKLVTDLSNEGCHNLDSVERGVTFLNTPPPRKPVKTTEIRKIIVDTRIVDIHLKNRFFTHNYKKLTAGNAEIIVTEILNESTVLLDTGFALVTPAFDVNWEQIAGFLNNKYRN